MTLVGRVKRALCWWVRHDPEQPLDQPLAVWNDWPGSSFVFRQYRCTRCGNLFWQVGYSSFVQLHDDDARLRRMM